MTTPIETKQAKTQPTLSLMEEMPEAAQDALVNIAQGIIIGYELRQKETENHGQD